mmetsp:Transcript_13606/g.25559  ORF Transcript_13606/g.25559 Transcript_13606/m.25559 type:complete len:131 (+) Transcript_13606:193-585(+)
MNYSGKHHHNSLLSVKATPRSSSLSCHFFDSSTIRPLIILLLVLVGMYKYLAFANNARYKFTMSPHVMPNLLYTPQAEKMVQKLNKLRAKVGIVKPFDDNKKSASLCSNVLHDNLFFENNSAPTLFFQLN